MLWYEAANGSPYRLFSNHQGSVIGITSDSGAMRAINTYDEYGVPGAESLSANIGRFRYTGQMWLREIGLYHYKARFYSATLGRFIQVDPVGYKDQINLYSYVGNEPVKGRDPTGMFELKYFGPNAGILQRELIATAAMDPILQSRYESLRDDKLTHEIREADALHPVSVTTRPDDNINLSNFNLANPSPDERLRKGEGVGTVTYVKLSPVTLKEDGFGHQSLKTPIGAQLAHEALSHAYDFSKGQFSPRYLDRESQAVDIENIYRRAAKIPPRFYYSGYGFHDTLQADCIYNNVVFCTDAGSGV